MIFVALFFPQSFFFQEMIDWLTLNKSKIGEDNNDGGGGGGGGCGGGDKHNPFAFRFKLIEDFIHS